MLTKYYRIEPGVDEFKYSNIILTLDEIIGSKI